MGKWGKTHPLLVTGERSRQEKHSCPARELQALVTTSHSDDLCGEKLGKARGSNHNKGLRAGFKGEARQSESWVLSNVCV